MSPLALFDIPRIPETDYITVTQTGFTAGGYTEKGKAIFGLAWKRVSPADSVADAIERIAPQCRFIMKGLIPEALKRLDIEVQKYDGQLAGQKLAQAVEVLRARLAAFNKKAPLKDPKRNGGNTILQIISTLLWPKKGSPHIQTRVPNFNTALKANVPVLSEAQIILHVEQATPFDSGAFKKVYRLPNTDYVVAVMEYRNAHQRGLAHNEVEVAWGVQGCSYVARVLLTFESGSAFYTVMPFYHGTFHSQPPTLKQIGEVAKGLTQVHQLGIIHLDLKPKNIFVDAKGQVAIGDWGLSLYVKKAGESPGMRGSPRYMAPELLWDRVATVATDVFSFCVMFWELTGGSTRLKSQRMPTGMSCGQDDYPFREPTGGNDRLIWLGMREASIQRPTMHEIAFTMELR